MMGRRSQTVQTASTLRPAGCSTPAKLGAPAPPPDIADCRDYSRETCRASLDGQLLGRSHLTGRSRQNPDCSHTVYRSLLAVLFSDQGNHAEHGCACRRTGEDTFVDVVTPNSFRAAFLILSHCWISRAVASSLPKTERIQLLWLLWSCLRRLDRFIQSTARTLGLCIALGETRVYWQSSFASDSSNSSISLSGCLGLCSLRWPRPQARSASPCGGPGMGFAGLRDSRGRSSPFLLNFSLFMGLSIPASWCVTMTG